MGKSDFKTRFRELYDLSGCPSITQFAKMLDMNRQSVDRYYNGERCPDALALVKICERMNITADWLLGLTDVKAPSQDIQNAVAALGISEKAARKIVDADPGLDCSKFLSHLIESESFYELLNSYKEFLEASERITESVIDEPEYTLTDDNKVVLSFNQAAHHFKRLALLGFENVCDEDYFKSTDKATEMAHKQWLKQHNISVEEKGGKRE